MTGGVCCGSANPICFDTSVALKRNMPAWYDDKKLRTHKYMFLDKIRCK